MTKQNNSDDNPFLVEVIREPQAIDALAEIFEVGGDTFFQEGVFKEIPILGSALSIIRATTATRNELFLQKIMHFISQYDLIEPTFKYQLISRFRSDKKYKQHVSEVVFTALERLDQIDKADAYGVLFAAYVKGECLQDEFRRCTAALQAIDWNNINLLQQFYTEKIPGGAKYVNQGFVLEENKPFMQGFLPSALVSVDYNARPLYGQIYPRGSSGAVYTKTPFGEKFLRLLGRI